MAKGALSSLTGKPLSAFLQILRAHGVLEYPTEHGVIKLAQRYAPAPQATAPADAEPGKDEGDEGEEPDFRFVLERLDSKAPKSAAHKAAAERATKLRGEAS